jgi:hypothetical protein
MNLDQITTKCWILALFERDDGERLLLGDGWFDFKDSLQHFQPNTFANDVIELQGSDGQMLAGQVRRGAPQSFDGYIGDPITNRQTIEQHRREFLMFFRKRHHYKVVYIFPDGTAIQRKQGYITDAPSVPEIRQKFPEYHVALNFEDANYYEYAENAQGEEIFSNIRNINISTAATGGLVWDNLGAVSDQMGWKDIATATGQMLAMTNPESIKAPIASFEMTGNIEQTTYTGKNLFNVSATPWVSKCAYNGSGQVSWDGYYGITEYQPVQPNTQYTFSNSTGKPIYYGLQYYDSAKNILNTIVVNTTTFTTPANCAYIRFAIQNSSAPTWTQLEQGSTATSFEKYVGGTHAPNPNYPQPIETVTGRQTIEVRGKNLLDMPITSGSSNGITWAVQDDGSIIINGTTTAGVNIRANFVTLPAIVGETYTLSATGMNGIVNFGYKNITSGNNIFVVTSGSPSATEVVTSEMLSKANRLDMFITSGKTFNNQRVTLQLELGNQATAYEEYRAQNYEVNLGKNLWNTTVENGGIDANGGSFVSTTQLRTVGYVEIEPSTEYTFSNTNNLVIDRVCYYDGNKTFIERGAYLNVGTFTTPNNGCRYARLVIRATNGSNITPSSLVNPQIEKGYTASSYSAYFEPIEVCKIGTYQDKIYKSGDKWYLKKEVGKVVLDGSESYSLLATLTTVSRYTANSVVSAKPSSQCYSNNFSWFSNQATNEQFNAVDDEAIHMRGDGTGIGIKISTSTASTANALKTWLGSNNTTVYYVLATPTTTEITNEEILEGLNSAAGLKLFPGQNNIMDQTPNAQPTMTVQYYTALGPGGGLVWESGEAGGATIIEASGLDSAFPLWTVPGPSTNPTLTNITTSQSITWQGTVPAGQTLEIDMDKQTATLAGANVYAFVSGDWIRIDPGPNRMTYVGTGATQASTLSWNNIVG